MTARATADMAGKSASACISIAQGRRNARSSAKSTAVSGIPSLWCASYSVSMEAEIGAIVSGNAPSRLMQPLTVKSRASDRCAASSFFTMSTAMLSAERAISSVPPSVTAAHRSDGTTMRAKAVPSRSGMRNGALGISQNPSTHVSTPISMIPSGRAARGIRSCNRSTSRMPMSVK